MKNRILRWLFLGTAPLLIVVFAAQLPAADKAKKQLMAAHATTTTPAQPLVWPMPPAVPRVRWVQQFFKFDAVEQKTKQKKSWFERVAGADEVKEKERKLRRPYGIAVDSKDRVYVADFTVRGVAIFDFDKRQVVVRGSTARAPILFPIGVALDESDRLFVSDATGRSITCFSPEGEVLSQFGRGELERPTGLAIDREQHRLYVADPKAHRISVFNTEKFQFIKHLGGPSTGEREPGKFRAPANVAVDRRGNLYVTEMFNHRVQIFDRRGRFLRAFGEQGDGPGFFARPKGVGIDSDGNIYVVDAEFNNFQIFDSQGEALMFVGSFGQEPGQFVLPAGLYIDQHDRIYVTEQSTGRVQVFQYIRQADTAVGKEVRSAKQ